MLLINNPFLPILGALLPQDNKAYVISDAVFYDMFSSMFTLGMGTTS